MKRARKRVATGGVGVLVAVAMFAVGASGCGSTSNLAQYHSAMRRVHARNVQLRTYLVMLMRRRGGPVGPAGSRRNQSSASVDSGGGESAQASSSSTCDPNYSGACLEPNASDYDCAGGSGNGPDYTGEVTVVGEDHYDLDADGDGVGCEAE